MASKSINTENARSTADALRAEVERLKKDLSESKRLEIRLNEALHDLHVHQEELRTQNEDLIAAQREIADAHAKFLDLFDYAPNGYFILNTDGIVTEVNMTAANLLGRARNAILGKPLWLFVQESARNRFNEYLRAICSGQSEALELNLTRTDGKSVPVEFHGVSVKDDKKPSTCCRIAAVDVTRRSAAENALRQANQWLDSILTTIPDIVYRLDEKGAIKYISRAIKNYGFETEDFLNKSYLSMVHPEDRRKAYQLLNEKRTDDRHTKSLEIRLFDQSRESPHQPSEESELVFSINAVGLYSKDDMTGEKHYIGTQGIAHDITDHKRSERARHKLKDELQRAHRMEAIGTLAGGIAHNFNNLLMGIQGSVSLLRFKDYDTESDFLLNAIEECVQRGGELTKRLLGFARGGKYVVHPTDMNNVILSTLKIFNPTHKNIEILQDLEPYVWLVQADQGQMEQVLLNLFINASQAMNGGGTLKIRTRNQPAMGMQAGSNPDGLAVDCISIVVEDNGIGMDEKTRSHIFEPFFSTKPIGSGTGLGLASVYGIVKNHGGMIHVESTAGHGSMFEVLLPADINTKIERLPTGNTRLEKGQGVILLVDDEKVVCDMVSEMLASLGYVVKIANDGTEAVSIYQSDWETIQSVVLDIIMPGLSGLETYARLKTINPDINVIFSSGYSPDEHLEHILQSEEQRFLQKPFNLQELSAALFNPN